MEMAVKGFNPRPREGATLRRPRTQSQTPGFNPRPREGATIDTHFRRLDMNVSIHAPVKGRQYSIMENK